MKAYVLITGASSGIGRAVAKRLANEGKNLILVARRKERLEELKAELAASRGEVMIHALDLTNKASVEALFATIESLRIEAVINNAGAAFGRDPLPDAADEDLEAMIELDITAFLRVARLCIPHLKKSQGHLLNVGSIAGLEVYEGATTYCGAKSFVHAVTKGLRIDLLGSGIRVTEIAPGNVDTEFSAVRYKGDLARAKKVYEGYEPLHAEDIADAMWFALSRPAHVNIEHMLIMPTAQASAMRVARKEV